jgi:hypothetical protein
MDQSEFSRPQYNLLNGQFLKGHVPHNKGKKWSEWMDMRKAKKIIRIAKQNLKPNMNLGGHNRREVVLVTDDGRWVCFESAAKAAELTNLCRRNISHCCQGKRKKCGKYRWFYFDDDQWTKLVNK